MEEQGNNQINKRQLFMHQCLNVKKNHLLKVMIALVRRVETGVVANAE